MSIPVGVTTVMVNVVPPDGIPSGRIRVAVAPTINLEWSATGETLEEIVSTGNALTFELPAVDQAGFVTPTGDPFTGWQYVLTLSGSIGGVPFSETRLLKVLSTQTSVDITFLDLIDQAAVDARVQTAGRGVYTPRQLSSFVTLGDSRTLLNGRVTEPASASGSIATENRGYVSQALVMLRHRMHWLKDGGVGGDTTAQMLARVDGLLDLNPGWLIGMGVINSVNQGVGSATIISELTRIFNKCAAKGVRVVWGTDWISGGTDTAGKKQVAAEVNEWLRRQTATRPSFYLVEYASVMSDAATGIPPATLAADQLHQDAPGAYAMASELVKVLSPLVPPSDRLIASNVDASNLLDNGMMLGNVSGLATGWTKGSATVPTYTKVARTDGIGGEWQQVACTAETVSSLSKQITLAGTTFGVGDRVFAELEFETDASGWDVTEFTLQLQYIGGSAGSSSNPKVVNDLLTAATTPLKQPRIASGILRTPVLLIGTGATHLQTSIRLKGTGTYRVSRARIAKA